jgi:two-component sensor histidine kinase
MAVARAMRKHGVDCFVLSVLEICASADHLDIFTMSWTERDGPPVSAPKRRGFGAIVMEAMTERSVDGKVDIDYARSGLTWRLTCPAANALEPRNVSKFQGIK